MNQTTPTAGNGPALEKTMRFPILTTLLTLAALLAAPTLAAAGDADRGGRSEQPELAHEIVHLQHIQPRDAEHALRPFVSRWGQLDANASLGTLTIVDEAALVRKMMEVLAEIDVPRQGWIFHIWLVLAEEDPSRGPDAGPLNQMPEVAEELTTLFQYNVYSELDSTLLEVTDGHMANLHLGGDPGYQVELVPHARGVDRVSVDFHLYKPRTIVKGADVTQVRNTIVATNFEAKPGDTTVVGASRLDGGEKALITIVQTRPAGE